MVHAAALKQVPASKYNPLEFIKTNVTGTANVVMAAIDAGVQKVVALSTDKAASPANLYGATKMCLESLITNAHVYSNATTFAAVRYGNVIDSRGSVIPIWRKQLEEGRPLTFTDLKMTRFLIKMDEAIQLVEQALELGDQGDILVPKIPSANMWDVATAVANGSFEHDVIGIRPGEKLHETLIGEDEPSFDCGLFYKIAEGGSRGFNYSSDTNRNFLGVDAIKSLLA